jgi:hypothetical protein
VWRRSNINRAWKMDVPLSSTADSAQNPTDVDQPAALGEWDCKANDVITFKLGTPPPSPQSLKNSLHGKSTWQGADRSRSWGGGYHSTPRKRPPNDYEWC